MMSAVFLTVYRNNTLEITLQVVIIHLDCLTFCETVETMRFHRGRVIRSLFLFGCLWLFVFHSWIGFWAVGKPICGTAGKPATPTNAWKSTVKLSATNVYQEGWCSQSVCLACHIKSLQKISCVTGVLSDTEHIFYYLRTWMYISSASILGVLKTGISGV